MGRGLYYGSYRSPRVLLWSIGVVILVLMMAKLWPNCNFELMYSNLLCTELSGLPFILPRTRALSRIGPHDNKPLEIIIGGMLGDFWSNKISGKVLPSVRFSIEQSIINSGYIFHLWRTFGDMGYLGLQEPLLYLKAANKKALKTNVYSKPMEVASQFNYRLSLFTFTSLVWIHDGFYHEVNGKQVKRLPEWIHLYLTPLAKAHWFMQDGSRQAGQGVYFATNSFTR